MIELYGGHQKIGVVLPPRIDFVAGHDLVFGLLQFDHFAKLVGLGGLTLANDLRGRLEQAEEQTFGRQPLSYPSVPKEARSQLV